MANLTRLLGGPKLYVKRDDCTGLATGGNKTRKLDFLMGDALAQGADTRPWSANVRPSRPEEQRHQTTHLEQ